MWNFAFFFFFFVFFVLPYFSPLLFPCPVFFLWFLPLITPALTKKKSTKKKNHDVLILQKNKRTRESP